MLMVNKNIYIRTRDEPVWQRAEEWARAHDRSLSWVLTKALELFLENEAGESRS
jgi:hypothetical protein